MNQDLSPQDFLNITREKFRKMVKEAKPLMCWYSITEECDLRCKFCFADSGKPLEDELTTREVYHLLDNIAEAGTQAIVFGGGEPTLREDLLEVMHYAARYKNMFVALNTHGQWLDSNYVRGLVDAGISQVKVSVDGLKESHDWNRGEGTFEKCIQALKNCVDAGIESVIWIATISQLNYEEIPQMIKRAMDLGVAICMVQLFCGGRWKGRRDLMLTREQTRDWQRYLVEQAKIYGWERIQFEDRYQICEDECALRVAGNPCRIGDFMDTPCGCISGIWQYIINASGKVVVGDINTPEHEIGDLRKQRLSEIWHNSELANLLRDRDKLKGKCGRCELRFVCGGCRRMAYSVTGDIMAPDPQCWYKPKLEVESDIRVLQATESS
ncbi:MAG: radical SAM protein [Dehalococcoidia bacterium]|nr:radical SAM protein [Dehalococcoidia bacterium]